MELTVSYWSWNFQRFLKFCSHDPGGFYYPCNSNFWAKNLSYFWSKLIILHEDMKCVLYKFFFCTELTISDDPKFFGSDIWQPQCQPHSSNVNYCVLSTHPYNSHFSIKVCHNILKKINDFACIWSAPSKLFFLHKS